MPASGARVVGSVASIRQVRDVEVSDPDNVKVVLLQIRQHRNEMRETLGIYREWPITFLIVDVQVERVRRNPVGAQSLCDSTQLRFGFVTVA